MQQHTFLKTLLIGQWYCILSYDYAHG